MTQLQRKFSTPSLCAFIGGIQVSETSWFIVLCRLALTIPKPHHRPRCRTCDITERTTTVTNANGDIRLKGRFDCTTAGVVYVITCQRCQAVHWRNQSKAFGSFRGTPSFSGGLQTEPPLPGRWFPHGRTVQSCECLW